MGQRTTKEYKLSNINDFKSLYGTVNKHKPDVVYIRTKSKIKPMYNKQSFADDMVSFKTKVQKYTKDLVKSNGLFKKDYIFNIETTENSLAYKKVSYLKYDLYLMPLIIKPINQYEDEIEKITVSINSYIQNQLDLLMIENLG